MNNLTTEEIKQIRDLVLTDMLNDSDKSINGSILKKMDEALHIHDVVVPKGTLCPTCGEDQSIEDWQTYYRCGLCDTKF